MIERILFKTIDLEQLIISQPSLFDLSVLDINDKMTLLEHNPKFFLDKINPDELKLYERVLIVLNTQNKKIQSKFVLSEYDILHVHPDQYYQLLLQNFSKYIRKDRFSELSKTYQVDIFIREPMWVINNIGTIPKLTFDTLSELSRRKPNFIDTYITEFSTYSTGQYFWRNMIKYKSIYEELFLKNTKSLSTKTDVRQVFRKYPHLIKKLNKDIIEDSKLTCKEWILLCNSIIVEHPLIFKNWDFSDELKEIFKLDLMAECLTGESKISIKSKNAMKNLFKKDEIDEIDEVEDDDF